MYNPYLEIKDQQEKELMEKKAREGLSEAAIKEREEKIAALEERQKALDAEKKNLEAIPR